MAIPFTSIFWGFVGLISGLAARAWLGGTADDSVWALVVILCSCVGFLHSWSVWLAFMTLPFILCSVIASGHEFQSFGFWAWLVAGLLLNAFHIRGHTMAVKFAYHNGRAFSVFASRFFENLEKDNLK